MSPSSLLTLTGLIFALPLSVSADDKTDASRSRVGGLASGAAAKVRSGDVAEIYGERSRNDAGAGVDANGPRGTRADANLPGSQLPGNLRGTLPPPPKPTLKGDMGGGYIEAASALLTRARDWWSPPEPPVGKLVENPGFERAVCANGQEPPCPMQVMMLGENTPHVAKVTDFVDYGEIKGDVFVQPKWWEFWKEAKPSGDEVSQGGVGDCFLLASLAAIANKEPAILTKMIRQHKRTQATWVNFYEGGKPVLVGPVDNLFPVYKKGLKAGDKDIGGQSAFAKPIGGPPPPKWPLIIEKAYTIKFRGSSYGDLNRGGLPSDAMTHITGRPSHWYAVDPKDKPLNPKPVEFSTLVQWDTNGQPIIMATKSMPTEGCPDATAAPVVSTTPLTDSICTDPLYMGKVACPAGSDDIVCKAGKSSTLAKSHAYWVKKVDATNMTVSLANPWGPHMPLIVWPWERLQKSLYVVFVNEKK